MDTLEQYEKLIRDFAGKIRELPERWVSRAASPFEKLAEIDTGLTIVLVTIRETGVRAVALWDIALPSEYAVFLDSIKAFPLLTDAPRITYFAFFDDLEVIGLSPVTEEAAFISLSRLSPYLYTGQKPL